MIKASKEPVVRFWAKVTFVAEVVDDRRFSIPGWEPTFYYEDDRQEGYVGVRPAIRKGQDVGFSVNRELWDSIHKLRIKPGTKFILADFPILSARGKVTRLG